MSKVFEMQNVVQVLEVYEDKLTITPKKGAFSFLVNGGIIRATITIPFSSIIGIQFQEAGVVLPGDFQFLTSGGDKSNDDNTFSIQYRKDNDLAKQIKEFIEAKVQELQAPRTTQPQLTISLSDELQKLANLRDSGILSDQEFQAAKDRLIKQHGIA